MRETAEASEEIASLTGEPRLSREDPVHMPNVEKRSSAPLRAKQRVKSLDALHLAVAAAARVDLFVTNDQKLVEFAVLGIGEVVGLDDAVARLQAT